MSIVAWPKLMQLGMVQLRLPPDVFWRLTPAELMLMAGIDVDANTMSRSAFLDLAASYPDENKGVSK